MNLESNHISKLPDSFRKLESLQKLNLRRNDLSGLSNEELEDMFEKISDIKTLRTLTLNQCFLSTLPNSFERLTQLTSLSLYENVFEYNSKDGIERVFQIISRCSNLEYLDLGGNKLSTLSDDILESIFANLAQIPNLKTLYIGANDFSLLPKSITLLQNVKKLELKKT